MVRSTVFTSRRGQAVRLPELVALPKDVREVEIVRLGLSLLISPAGRAWDDFFADAAVADDFMANREQPTPEVRAPL